MATSTDNPASRLWEFLTYMRSYPAPKEPIRRAISDYFDLDNGEPNTEYSPRMFRCIAELIDLPTQIRSAVRSRPVPVPPHELVLRPMTNIGNAMRFLAALGQPVSSLNQQFNDTDLIGLEHCIYHIAPVVPVRNLDKNALDAIRDLAHEIMGLANESDDLDVEAKTFIWTQARRIWESTEVVKAAGSGVLVSALDESIGHLVRNVSLQQAVVRDETAGKRFFDLLTKVALVVNLAAAPFALTADAVSLLQVEEPSTVQAPGAVDDLPSRAT